MDSPVACFFPNLTDGVLYSGQEQAAEGLESLRRNLDISFKSSFNDEESSETHDSSREAFFGAAWGLLLARYVGTEDVSFVVARASAGNCTMTTCTWTALDSQTQQQLLLQAQETLSSTVDQGSWSEFGESKELPVPDFANTMILLEDADVEGAGDVLSSVTTKKNLLVLHLAVTANGISKANLDYHYSMLSDNQAANVATTLMKILDGLKNAPQVPIKDLDYMSQEHLEQIWRMNSHVPEAATECFHDVVQKQFAIRPEATAVDAWDARLTYGELVPLATRLASHLQSRGVCPGVVVPLCFEPSSWSVVATLAVSMAGGAFVNIPPSLPQGRKDIILSAIDPPILLTTSDYGHLWENTGINWITIEDNRIADLEDCDSPPEPLAKPSDMFYVVFTSGSTGTPKGCIVAHDGFGTAILRNGPLWKFTPDRRIFQMASHAFDMSTLEIGLALAFGACVCVPRSTEIQESLPEAMNKYNVDLSIMTPAVARIFTPEEVPSIRVLLVGGEAWAPEIIDTWAEKIDLIQIYGPTECSAISSSAPVTRLDYDAQMIGYPQSAAFWVVMPENRNRLAPIGSPGELLISGPIVGLGYYKNPEKTAEAFIDVPDFVKDDPVFGSTRFYKTGDLVRCNSDGGITFCGRVDNQVKLNGQRIELEEVEYNISLFDGHPLSVVLVPKTGHCQRNLVAVIAAKSKSPGDQPGGTEIELVNGHSEFPTLSLIQSYSEELRGKLPRYMVPTVWAFIASMPITISGKVDRVRVRRWLEGIDEDTAFSIVGRTRKPVEDTTEKSDLEERIQAIWSEVLKVPQDEIGLHQSFFSLGGDSVLAQKAAAKCRKENILSSMVHILSSEGVSEVAALAHRVEIGDGLKSSPTLGFNLSDLQTMVDNGYQLTKFGLSNIVEIDDVYPCSAAQEGMLLGQIRRPGSYHLRFFYQIHTKNDEYPDFERFRAAWTGVVALHPGLRTVFVDDLPGDAVYHAIVLKAPQAEMNMKEVPPDMPPSEVVDLFRASKVPFRPHRPPHRLTACVSAGKLRYCMIEMSHAIIDGAGMEALFKDLVRAYHEGPDMREVPPYRNFVEYEIQKETEQSAQYWSSALEGCSSCILSFGTTRKADVSASSIGLRRDFDFDRSKELLDFCLERRLTIASAVRAAWSTVLRTYTGSNDVCFGYLSAGRHIPVKDIDEMVGPCFSIQPCRAQIEPGASLVSIAEQIQDKYMEALPYQHYPLSKLQRQLYPNGGGTMFNTAVSMEWIPGNDLYSGSSFSLEEMIGQEDPTEFEIAICIEIVDGHIKLGFLYWPTVTEFELENIASALTEALYGYLKHPDMPVDTVSLVSEKEVAKMQDTYLHQELQETKTILTSIRQHSELYPDSPGLVSWDGEFSYAQIEEITTKIALDLIRRGVQRGDKVVICMYKSCWAIMMLMAILKSGGVLVAATPFQPKERLEKVVYHSSPKLVIVDPQHIELFQDMHDSVISFEMSEMESLPPQEGEIPTIEDTDVATIIYTSGSTGEPKGMMIDHGALATSILLGHGNIVGFSRDTRALQFSSFTFDFSYAEIFTTLAFGGCICVPSEEEKSSNLAGCINRMQANLAFLTPSVARTIQPEDVPCLKTLLLGGEAMSVQTLQTWASSVALFNGYGPAEATVLISVRGPMTPDDDQMNVGHPVKGSRVWLTEVADDRRLAPRGCIGQVMIESRQLAQGYLNAEEATKAAFIPSPSWLAGSSSTTIYKTGDLARYEEDGTLRFIGRQDTQTKLRDQRLELGAVEFHLLECIPATSIVADVIIPAGEQNTEKAILAAFVYGLEGTETSTGNEETPSACPFELSTDVKQQLTKRLPTYMIPLVFFTIDRLPLNMSGKADRKRLREIGATFTLKQLAETRNGQTKKALTAANPTEESILKLWSQTLNIEAKHISLDDNFAHLGGDSIAAMKLAAAARRNGMTLSVADIFQQPTIRKQASVVLSKMQNTQTNGSIAVTNGYNNWSSREIIIQAAVSQCRISRDLIDDIYPCTALQEGMMAHTVKKATAYTRVFTYSLPASVDLDRFRDAWEQVAQAHPALRTRIVHVKDHGSFQVVVKEKLNWEVFEATQSAEVPDLTSSMGLGTPLARFAFFHSLAEGSETQFHLSLHHALYDGWSVPLLLDEAEEAYQGKSLQSHPVKPFISHLVDQRSSAEEFWKKQLADVEPQAFPHLPSVGYDPSPKSGLSRTFTIPSGGITNFTLSTKLRFAWALTVSQYTNTKDIIFGMISTGRGIQVMGVEELVACTIATFPALVVIDQTQTVTEALRATENRSIDTIPHEHLGLQNISRLGQAFETACRFQSLFVVHPHKKESTSTLFIEEHDPSTIEPIDSYALILGCQMLTGAVQVDATFDRNVIDELKMERILCQFEHNLRLIYSEPDMTVSSIETLTVADWHQIEGWNNREPYPSEMDTCVNDLLHQKCLSQPDAPAICSWDGDLTYKELDDLSSQLALHLQNSGVGPETFVPLLFGKSRWAVVAQLAVVKAGGALAPLDIAHPLERLQKICRDIKASMVLVAEDQLETAGLLALPPTTVNHDLFVSGLPDLDQELKSTVSPSNALFAIFTSGSTGTPKGVVIEHQSYYVSALAQIQGFKLDQNSRVLQFAGYGFDASVMEHLTTLVAGGCICIPSDHDRLNQLVDVSNRLEITHAYLTPSVARSINPKELNTLKRLVLIGEPVTESDVELWSPFLDLINGYGPSECSIISTIQECLSTEKSPSNIGQAAGGVCWIVDPNDIERLLPIGAIGELIIEGIIVGRGYLNGAKANAASFITQSPEWLKRLRGADSCRVYKTGDLVRYTADGSFEYIGRKDTMVKLRGQRIDLLEIEHHLRLCFETMSFVIAEVVMPQDGLSPMLVAFLGSHSSGEINRDQSLFLPPMEQSPSEIQQVKKQLRDHLPAYMVPEVFIPLRDVPLLKVSGKVDRQSLKKQVTSMSREWLKSYSFADAPKVAPSTEKEKMLRQTWARILNIPSDDISIHDNFFHIGGDSISGMQLSMRCSTLGLPVSVADLFRYKTIANLAAHLETTKLPLVNAFAHHEERAQATEWYELSPIQRKFFEVLPDGLNHFNQSFFLRLTRHVHDPDVARAIEAIVIQHPMLRTRYRKEPDNQWKQAATGNISDCYRYKTHQINAKEDIAAFAIDSQTVLDFQDGPIFAVDLFILPNGEQYIFLVAHHLVIDLVSWRIILEDVEEFLVYKNITRIPSMSFQTWCHLQLEYGSQILTPEKAYPGYSQSQEVVCEDFWELNGKQTTFEDSEMFDFSLDQQTTKNLLAEANIALRTQPVEIMQAILLYSFVQAFPDRPAPVIWTEGHGREPWDPSIDLTSTVGWFTTIWPTIVQLSASDDVVEAVRRTKDGRHQLPSNGWAYFASRYLNADGQKAFKEQEPPEIIFNYLGRYQQLERAESLMQLEKLDESVSDVAVNAPRFGLVDVSAVVLEDRLTFNFVVNRNMKYQTQIRQWIEGCEALLQTAVQKLTSLQPSLTLADIPLLSLGYDQLDEFLNIHLPKAGLSANAIEDIYPCSPVQTGILLSQLKDSRTYQSRVVWRAYSPSSIDVDRLRDAWKQLVNRHTALRTIFLGVSGRNYIDQVVLKSEAELAQLGIEYGSISQPTTDVRLQSPHKFLVSQTQTGDVICEFSFNHALMDAISLDNITQELGLAYDGELPSLQGPPYRDYVAYLQELDTQSAHEFWQGYLSDTEPCYLRSLDRILASGDEKRVESILISLDVVSEIQEFCKLHTLTPTNVMHVVWALVLQGYTSMSTVSFGYVTFGRDIPMKDAQDAVGLFINALARRIHLQGDSSVLSVMKNAQEELMNSLAHQHYSLANVLHAKGLSGRALFNTGISIQDLMGSESIGQPTVGFEQVEGEDPTEYDLSINIGISKENLDVAFNYWTSFLTKEQAACIAQTFQHVLSQVLEQPSRRIDEIEVISREDKVQINKWNQDIPESVDNCVHNLIQEFGVTQPDAPAVCAWDGDFTYKELNDLASTVSRHIFKLGACTDIVVPICFEKSRWVAVSVLAVLKAGAAFVLLDPTHPLHRLQEICRDVGAQLVISSQQNKDMAAELAEKVVEVSDEVFEWPEDDSPPLIPAAEPSNAAYAVFTSGSTGKPKGVMIEHRSLCAVIYANKGPMGLDSSSRFFHFASYAFDVSVLEIMFTITLGGCLCVPTDAERKDNLAAAVTRLKANILDVTPTVARTLDPETVKGIDMLVLGGEAVSSSDFETWHDKTKLVVAYGPAECTIAAFATTPRTMFDDPRNLGNTTGCIAWIVSPEDHTKLMPIGAIGELAIEGPTVGRGYINNPVKTEEVFVNFPSWLATLRNGQQGKLYKTGDLVSYAQDGTIRFWGRKDTQIKLRGQRIETGEVEYHVKQAFPDVEEAFVDLVTPADKDKSPYLVACVLQHKHEGHPQSAQDGESIFEAPSDQFNSDVKQAEPKLHGVLPGYMVPTVFLPLSFMPMTKSFKVDRNLLRRQLAALSWEDIRSYTTAYVDRREPKTANEKALFDLISGILNLPPDSMWLDDDFFRLGGDSVVAMRLVDSARQKGFELSVYNIFKHPKLSNLALKMTRITGNDKISIEAPRSCSLLPQFREASPRYPFDLDDIVDVLPTTQIQRFYVQKAQYTYCTIDIPGSIDVDRLQKALRALLEKHSALRTVFVPFQESLVQVILRQINLDLEQLHTEDGIPAFVEAMCRQDSVVPVPYGTPYFEAKLVSQNESLHTLVIRLSHAQYDGVSMPTFFTDLATSYGGDSLVSSPVFADFVIQRAELNSRPETSQFWENLLAGSSMTYLESDVSNRTNGVNSTAGEKVMNRVEVFRTISMDSLPEGITLATVLKTAWSLVLRKRAQANDLVFGQVNNGRSMSLNGIENVVGPCTTFVPVRVTLEPEWKVQDLFNHLQDQHVQSLAFETMDLDDIVHHSTEWPTGTRFGTVVQCQNISVDNDYLLDGIQCSTRAVGYNHAPESLFVLGVPQGSELKVYIVGNDEMIDEGSGEILLEEVCQMIGDVLIDSERLVMDL
ncbi:hypothetical protein ASPZODRAFT_117155 [Penicilliopsis zonata CBS 506.65]|uniref:Carrier domain-containing protein n=1 Tax=Penicilliopsis zonata CBS 506.65 TaxID=1073090 RepID=A0A1L9SHA2_9EURO|nr:hypothetical protein ASPZODRAFT_117155 [Penicilliopsis zonata CBS 506.65]OJJ46579.1 hypothetical protein ASPZODRAFT_117155 [Penicilliopsis zonata CBS 506.65]